MLEMHWIVWIVVGVIAGWIAEHLTGRRHGLLTNLMVGLLGAVLGGWLAETVNFRPLAGPFLNNLIVATFGAIVLLLIFGLVRRRN